MCPSSDDTGGEGTLARAQATWNVEHHQALAGTDVWTQGIGEVCDLSFHRPQHQGVCPVGLQDWACTPAEMSTCSTESCAGVNSEQKEWVWSATMLWQMMRVTIGNLVEKRFVLTARSLSDYDVQVDCISLATPHPQGSLQVIADNADRQPLLTAHLNDITVFRVQRAPKMHGTGRHERYGTKGRTRAFQPYSKVLGGDPLPPPQFHCCSWQLCANSTCGLSLF